MISSELVGSLSDKTSKRIIKQYIKSIVEYKNVSTRRSRKIINNDQIDKVRLGASSGQKSWPFHTIYDRRD